MDKPSEVFQDETGSTSFARAGLAIVLGVTLPSIILDAIITIPFDVPEPAYALLGGALTVFAVWAMGPRIAQYVGPQLAGIVSGIGAAKKSFAPERPTPDAETMVRRGPG